MRSEQDSILDCRQYNRHAGERQCTDTHTHTHRQRDGALLEAYGTSTKQRQPLESAGKQENEGEGLQFSIRQHLLLGTWRSPFHSLSSPFIAQAEEVVTAHHIIIIRCPF